MHQHTGFAGASTGQDQLTTHGGGYGLALGVVEGVQQEGEIIAPRGILGGGATPGKPGFALADKTAADDDRSVTGPSHWRFSPGRFQGASRAIRFYRFYDLEQFGSGLCLCMLRRRFGLNHYKNTAYDT